MILEELLQQLESLDESSLIENLSTVVFDWQSNKKTVEEILLKSCEKGYLSLVKTLIGSVISNSDFSVHDIKDDKGEGLIHKAARSGSLALCKYLVDELCVNYNSLTNVHIHAIYFAAQLEHNHLCLWFMKDKNINLKHYLAGKKGLYLLTRAIKGNSTELINILISKIVSDIEKIKASNNDHDKKLANELLQNRPYYLFFEALIKDHLAVEKLLGWAKELGIAKMMLVHVNHFMILSTLDIDLKVMKMEKLWGWAKELGNAEEMLTFARYSGFKRACEKGKTEVMVKLWGWAQELGKAKEMLPVGSYGFELACGQGRVEVIDKLLGWAKELGKAEEMLAADDYAGFRSACNNGQTEAMDKLRGWAKELGKAEEMLAADDYAGFRSACNNGQTEAMDKLRGWAKE
ncbi:MAG TPA: hypothetical protein QF353_01195, partial [Gammaproteobacteria bacterium]|nr:hypothetical protein [Gammaproteobacteria bacterium]